MLTRGAEPPRTHAGLSVGKKRFPICGENLAMKEIRNQRMNFICFRIENVQSHREAKPAFKMMDYLQCKCLCQTLHQVVEHCNKYKEAYWKAITRSSNKKWTALHITMTNGIVY